jgi:hypothetical protein
MLTAKAIVSSIRMSRMRQWWALDAGALILIDAKMPAKAEFLDIPLHELAGPELPYHVVAIRRGYDTLIPRADEVIKMARHGLFHHHPQIRSIYPQDSRLSRYMPTYGTS